MMKDKDLLVRTKKYALNIIKLVASLPISEFIIGD